MKLGTFFLSSHFQSSFMAGEEQFTLCFCCSYGQKPVKFVNGNWILQTGSKNPLLNAEEGTHPMAHVRARGSQWVRSDLAWLLVFLSGLISVFIWKLLHIYTRFGWITAVTESAFSVDNYFTFSILLSGFLTTCCVSVFHLFTPCSCQAFL